MSDQLTHPAVALGLADHRRGFRDAVIVLMAAFILLAPAATQVFGVRHQFLRPWKMYSGVGSGLLKGEFVVTGPAGEVRMLTPPQVFGLRTYPLKMDLTQAHRVHGPERLKGAVQAYCAGLTPGEDLAFRGWYATFDGWAELMADGLCRSEG